MGAPGYAFFCHRGHLVAVCDHHEIMEDPKKCGMCGSTNLRSVYEWQDLDYEPEDGPIVPYEPINTITKDIIKECEQCGHKMIIGHTCETIYDVSKLFKEKL